MPMAYFKSMLNTSRELCEDIITKDVTGQAYVTDQIHVLELTNIDLFTC